MANPRVIFLEKTSSLAEQVAEVFLDGVEGRPFNLSAMEVWVPTSGAARRIRHALAKVSADRGSGVISPKFSSPMKALLPRGPLASRSDREAAWGLVLQKTDRSRMEHLFPKGEVLEGEQALLSTAGMMCDLCDLLAEGGITPMDPMIPRVCEEDEERWKEISPLYRGYLDVLKEHTLWDPNEARIKAWQTPPGDAKALVIACIPDLPEAARRRAEALLEQGIPVRVLVWKPKNSTGWGGGFDAWGRPDAKEWLAAAIPLASDQIVMAKDPVEEATLALNFLSEAGGDHALVLGNPDLGPAFQAEVLRRGGSPFLPEGEPLARTEPAVVAAGWIDFRRERSLRTLRRLLETPRFAAWIGSKCGLTHERLLEACDALSLELLAETLTETPIPPRGIHKESLLADAVTFQKVILGELVKGPHDLITEIWKKDSAEEVLEVCEESSSVLSKWPDPIKAREASIVRALARRKSFGASKEGDLELSGWLEAPWSGAKRLALSGCVEGRLPASMDGHPFLPDHKRGELGVPDNATRRARDSYLLGCLTRAREASEFRCSFSKFGPDGSPSVPSALLMRCAGEDLPVRVTALFGKSRSTEASAPPVREHDWRWVLPHKSEPLERISVTDFASYLQCPFRFYLRKRLELREHDPEQREMDGMQFGSLVHKVLERYGKETPDLSDEQEIASTVISHLENEVKSRFGSDPSPAVRVQVEAARVRLLSFARVQTEQVAAGWKILETERKSSGDLVIGGLPLTGKIDRIEVNGDRVRVLDYKTQTTRKTPEEVHLQAISKSFFPESATTLRGKQKAWTDLQLPLYRKLAEKLYPGKTIETAYFVLAADPEESEVLDFKLDEELITTSSACAEEVASRISRGVYWPPQQMPDSWEDPLGIFLEGGKPEEVLDEATITFLKGNELGGTEQGGTQQGEVTA
jgi:ATP-dependent helicase/nuclease subunit B